MASYLDLIERKRRQFGEKFDASELSSVSDTVKLMYATQQRCRIDHGDGYTTDGYIGVTTGWKPCFIHLYNARSLGSSEIIGPDAVVIKIFDRKRARH